MHKPKCIKYKHDVFVSECEDLHLFLVYIRAFVVELQINKKREMRQKPISNSIFYAFRVHHFKVGDGDAAIGDADGRMAAGIEAVYEDGEDGDNADVPVPKPPPKLLPAEGDHSSGPSGTHEGGNSKDS
jgi:hypothetical protein